MIEKTDTFSKILRFQVKRPKVLFSLLSGEDHEMVVKPDLISRVEDARLERDQHQRSIAAAFKATGVKKVNFGAND